jgi:[acyl-carrier-protein] S-malonyltransferase
MSNKNLSILFTGQGSQYPEMGVELSNNFSWVKERYKQSSDILGYDVLKTQENPEILNLTEYSQPSIFIYTSIMIDFIKEKLKNSLPTLHLQDILLENMRPYTLQIV